MALALGESDLGLILIFRLISYILDWSQTCFVVKVGPQLWIILHLSPKCWLEAFGVCAGLGTGLVHARWALHQPNPTHPSLVLVTEPIILCLLSTGSESEWCPSSLFVFTCCFNVSACVCTRLNVYVCAHASVWVHIPEGQRLMLGVSVSVHLFVCFRWVLIL